MDNNMLLKECLDKDEDFKKDEISELIALAESLEDPDVYLELFEIYQYQDEIFKEKNSADAYGLTISREGNNFKLETNGIELILDDDLFFKYLGYLSDIYIPIYPIGTAFKMKNEYFSEQLELNDDDEIIFVVTNRFLMSPNMEAFAPYEGVIYPLGALDQEGRINFGPQLIDELLWTGYSDEMDETYIDVIKEEILLNRSLHSISFATDEELEELNKNDLGE